MSRFLRFILPFVTLGASELARWVATRLRTSNDLRRANLIAILAEGVVAELLARYPNQNWVDLIEQVVQILKTAIPSSPTSSEAVLRRAAATALRNAGVLPPAE